MNVGKLSRLNRLFSNPSGRICSVAIDHFVNYQSGLPEGLRDLPAMLERLISAGPDAVTIHKGVAKALWEPYAGRVPLIIQSCIARPDDSASEQLAVPEDALRLDADGFACVALVRGDTEAMYLRRVSKLVRLAEPWDMPVILHVYPRTFSGENEVEISLKPEDIAWAVRCAMELGVDVIKVPYTGDVSSYAQIVRSCPVRIVAAGGPKVEKFRAALECASGVIDSGAAGMTVGRNIWGAAEPEKTLQAFKAVIHDGLSPEVAIEQAGLRE